MEYKYIWIQLFYKVKNLNNLAHFTVTKTTIDDIHDWGVSKIKNDVKFSERAITNLDDILNATADVEQ
jgi:hypothetical protein